MARPSAPDQAELLLGKLLGQLRARRGMTRLQVGRIINETEQQVEKYENGEFIPLAILEAIAEALGASIQKKFIRRISTLRKQGILTKDEQAALAELYTEALAEEE